MRKMAMFTFQNHQNFSRYGHKSRDHNYRTLVRIAYTTKNKDTFKKTGNYIFKHFRVIKTKSHLFEKMSVAKSVSYILNRSC